MISTRSCCVADGEEAAEGAVCAALGRAMRRNEETRREGQIPARGAPSPLGEGQGWGASRCRNTTASAAYGAPLPQIATLSPDVNLR